MDCSMEERAGLLTLADRLRNICFVQGLYSNRIQTIVRSRNNDNFDEIAETAQEEESVISKQERYKERKGFHPKCSRCGRSDRVSSKCYGKVKGGNATAVCTTNSTEAISRHAATSPHNIQRRNFTECFNRSVTSARLCKSSLRMVEDRNMSER